MSHRLVWVLTVLTALGLAGRAALAQPAPIPLDPNADRLAQLNALIRVPSGVVDITGGLFEALSEMDEVPGQVYDYFLTDDSAGWRTLHGWAKAPAQQRAMENVAALTEGDGPFLLGVRYGETTWAEQGLGVLLGDGAPLVEMEFTYLDAVEDLALAMSIEMWDRAEAGDAESVSELVLAWVRLARIILDRETIDEKEAGYTHVMTCMQRLRDVLYTHPTLYDVATYTALLKSLDNDELELDIVRLPRGARLVTLDLIEKTMVPEGGVDPTKFGLVMAESLTPEDRPLELFSITASMNKAGAIHAGWYETYDEMNKAIGDWFVRWETPDFHSPTLSGPSDFEKLPPTSYEIITGTLGPIQDLFDLRLDALTELFGTRTAMAVLSFKSRNNRFPPNIASVAPQFVSELDVDPWSVHPRFRRGSEQNITRTRFEKSIPFQYLVPIRDQRWGPREEKVPYEITVSSIGYGGVAAQAETTPAATNEAPAEPLSPQATAEVVPDEEWAEWRRSQREIYNRFVNMPGMTEEMLFQTISISFSALESLPPERQDAAYAAQSNASVNASLATGLIRPTDITSVELRLVDETSVTEQNFQDVYRRIAAQLNAVPGQVAWYREALSGGNATIEKILDVDRRVIEAALLRNAQGVEVDVPSGFAGLGTFTVAFDDTVFLLWSVWDDQQNNAAREVGIFGTDYLIWPPLPTIARDGGSVK